MHATFLACEWMLQLFKVRPESTCVSVWVCSCGRVHASCACMCAPSHPQGVHVLLCTLDNGGGGGMDGKVHPLLNQIGVGFPAVQWERAVRLCVWLAAEKYDLSFEVKPV